jgi:hypothetical protein
MVGFALGDSSDLPAHKKFLKCSEHKQPMRGRVKMKKEPFGSLLISGSDIRMESKIGSLVTKTINNHYV